MPPKRKACRVRHVDEVVAPEHGPRQRQECERSASPDASEIDEVADKIYARISRAVQGGEHRREGGSFGDFHKQNPPSFNGKPEPMETKNWLLKLENLLRTLDYTNAQKVVYATFVLQGLVKKWWTCTERLLRMELGKDIPITWEKFKEVFNETYVLDEVRDQKDREFSNLVQGTMTVEEYAAKFFELSHFASYLILNEPKKVSKF